MPKFYGIDVAKWNGEIDWTKVKKTGKTFAICKITDKKNRVEESFFRNALGAYANGLDVGCYKYVYARSVLEAEEEARAVIKALDKANMPCGVWLDMEDASLYTGCTMQTLTDIINTEAKIIRDAGYKVGIYCNLYWYKNVLDVKNLPYVFWIARYPSNDTGVVKPSLNPLDLEQVCVWQYSSKGKVNGITGNVDLNTTDYNIVDIMSAFG